MTKIIKVQPEYRRKGKYDRNYKVVPKLILSGNWLEENGFKPSNRVRVECYQNQLVITSIED